MKKTLLLFLSVLCFSFASAQTGQPFPIQLCGASDVFFADETGAILGSLNPNEYTVTYHLSQADADAGVNALPDPYFFDMSTVVYARVTENANPSNAEILVFEVIINNLPEAPAINHTFCDSDGNLDGITTIDLESSIVEIVGGQSGTSVAFYMTYAEASAQVNQLPWLFTNMTQPQTIFYTITNWSTGCINIGTYTINVVNCNIPCPAPTNTIATNVTNNSFAVGWTETGTATSWEIVVVPAGSPAPGSSLQGFQATANPFVVTGFSCNNVYDVYVRSWCSDGVNSVASGWSAPLTVDLACLPEAGYPNNLEACSDTTSACFDLTQNDAAVLGTLAPENYAVSYYSSADGGVTFDAIANPSFYCVTQPGMSSIVVFARLDDLVNGTHTIYEFALTVRQVQASNFTPTPMSQCDQDLDGIVVFDLTTVAAQLNTSNPLLYYLNSQDATSVTGANALTNPQAFSLAATSGTQTAVVFVRENITGGCDIIYSLQLFASSNCNVANICSGANSLCASLDVPFSNTVGAGSAQPGINYGCLSTQPNPTWFYLPISQTGNLSFFIQSSSPGSPTPNLDVDFIVWGPFLNPTNVCGPAYLNSTTQIACSYSASPTESFTIPNAQPGQYYILMVTNFSNQSGVVMISQTNAGQPNSGDIDCTGLRMTAFLDTNGNGTKESNESHFVLGQFHYEKNDNGVIHNITSATGSASIYDINASNSYDLSYTIDTAYASNYSVSPSSYSNVSIIPGGGMSEYLFPVTVTQAYDDLAVTLVPAGNPNPGFIYMTKVIYTNYGSQTAASGTVTFSKPGAVSIVSVSEAGATITPTGFTYTFSNLQPFESREIYVSMQVPTIPTVNLGQVLTSSADIAPLAGDVAPANNSVQLVQTIVGSYDPNDKAESRGSYVLFSDFGADDFLYYTIRFENTGTAPAMTVKINDVLENQLDETSVRMVSASHEYVLDRTGNVLNWTFENIQLPYASANPEGAKGYVQFKVKPKAGFAVGDVIQNTASIYFDYNPAIITNTFETHFVNSLGNPVVGLSEFAMYPNPAGEQVTISLNGASDSIANIAVYDMLGKKVLIKPSVGNTETVDVSALAGGMYFVEVTTSAQVRTTKKLVIK